jgi:HSP20 family protein
MSYQLRTIRASQFNPNLAQWLDFGAHPPLGEDLSRRPHTGSASKRSPSYDLRQTPSHIEIKLAMPGVPPEALEVTLERRRLTVSGQLKADAPDASSQWLHQGLSQAHFEKVFDLAEDADPDGIRASIKFGLVTIAIPRNTDHLPRRIAVEH